MRPAHDFLAVIRRHAPHGAGLRGDRQGEGGAVRIGAYDVNVFRIALWRTGYGVTPPPAPMPHRDAEAQF